MLYTGPFVRTIHINMHHLNTSSVKTLSEIFDSLVRSTYIVGYNVMGATYLGKVVMPDSTSSVLDSLGGLTADTLSVCGHSLV